MLYGVTNIFLYIESLRVVDLLRKGVYNLKVKVFQENEVTNLAKPTIIQNPKLNKDYSHVIKEHEILNTNCYSSKKFFVQYINEYFLFGNFVSFQIELPLYNYYSNNVIVDFELVYYPTDEDSNESIPVYSSSSLMQPQQLQEKVVSQQRIRINKAGHGVHQYIPITFCDLYFCLFKIMIATSLVDIKFRHQSIESLINFNNLNLNSNSNSNSPSLSSTNGSANINLNNSDNSINYNPSNSNESLFSTSSTSSTSSLSSSPTIKSSSSSPSLNSINSNVNSIAINNNNNINININNNNNNNLNTSGNSTGSSSFSALPTINNVNNTSNTPIGTSPKLLRQKIGRLSLSMGQIHSSPLEEDFLNDFFDYKYPEVLSFYVESYYRLSKKYTSLVSLLKQSQQTLLGESIINVPPLNIPPLLSKQSLNNGNNINPLTSSPIQPQSQQTSSTQQLPNNKQIISYSNKQMNSNLDNLNNNNNNNSTSDNDTNDSSGYTNSSHNSNGSGSWKMATKSVEQDSAINKRKSFLSPEFNNQVISDYINNNQNNENNNNGNNNPNNVSPTSSISSSYSPINLNNSLNNVPTINTQSNQNHIHIHSNQYPHQHHSLPVGSSNGISQVLNNENLQQSINNNNNNNTNQFNHQQQQQPQQQQQQINQSQNNIILKWKNILNNFQNLSEQITKLWNNFIMVYQLVAREYCFRSSINYEKKCIEKWGFRVQKMVQYIQSVDDLLLTDTSIPSSCFLSTNPTFFNYKLFKIQHIPLKPDVVYHSMPIFFEHILKIHQKEYDDNNIDNNTNNNNNNNNNKFNVPTSTSTSGSFSITNKHLFVFVHGLSGSSYDLRQFKNYFQLHFPNFLFLMCSSIEENTLEDIQQMGEKIAQELHEYLQSNNLQQIAKISFLGHSLGGLVVRSALTSIKLKPYLSKLHSYISLSSPHLGTKFVSQSIVTPALWVWQKFTSSTCLKQLLMQDSPNLQDCYLYKLSCSKALEYFQYVFLISSEQDGYVPYHSARIEVPKIDSNKENSSKHFQTLKKMVQNLLDPIRLNNNNINQFNYQNNNNNNSSNLLSFIGNSSGNHSSNTTSTINLREQQIKSLPRFIKINVIFEAHKGVDGVIGRSAHIRMLDQIWFMQMLVQLYKQHWEN